MMILARDDVDWPEESALHPAERPGINDTTG